MLMCPFRPSPTSRTVVHFHPHLAPELALRLEMCSLGGMLGGVCTQADQVRLQVVCAPTAIPTPGIMEVQLTRGFEKG